MISKYIKGKTLIMIDAANLESSVKDMGWWIDYLKLRALFNNADVIQIRDYCVHHNTENQNKFFTFLKKNGFVLVTKPIKIIRQEDIEKRDLRKANFDVEIAIDAMKMLKRFDTLVLFSGDSDFDYLIKTLKSEGKIVVVVSTKYHISKELVQNSNKYIDIKKLRKEIERKNKKK